MATTNRIEFTTHLNHHAILRLVSDETTALVVENYYHKELAAQLAGKLIASATLAHYTHEIADGETLRQEYLGVDREGLPFNLIYDKDHDDELVTQYYEAAKHNIARIRSYVAPALTPIDKLRLELDEHYADGASVAAFQHIKMLAGIGRISHADMSHMSEDPPHFDALPGKFATLSGQFAANIYLKVPDAGGELELWDTPPMTPLASVPDDWRRQLPPSIKLTPKAGDLIIFNCRRPHAIRQFSGAPRVTMQVFIGYQPGQPLKLWN